ncbi:MAG: tRNA (adenosine(37)-N6)-threonylcarbamoyltransferase complex ATPase subunit type 1 TsaE [Candidatus Omnitrophica bacterium]|nr:tRNA (adenosine(37)-N6)-threonylcarbamoyltransferase complex ATPase subunit type 1 TsaE [Candidatus Omnitrophota bacterium]
MAANGICRRKDLHISKIYITKSRNETIALGAKLAKTLKPGDVIALIGELGSGKTTLTKGIARGLGVKGCRYVNSPSFVIIKEYPGKKILMYHFDVFRLDSSGGHGTIGYEEYFYGGGVCVVEWADRIKKLLPKKYIEVKIDIMKGNNRKISIKK